LFTLERTLARVCPAFDGEDRFALMPGVSRKLRSLGDCSVFVIATQNRTAASAGVDRVIAQIGDQCGLAIADCAIRGGVRSFDGAARDSTRDAIGRLLNKHCLPPSQAVLVGCTSEDERAAAECGLARFLWAWHYFAESPAGTS